jgi:SET domain-containing protein
MIKTYFKIYGKRISEKKGFGVFTNEFIPKGSIVEHSYCVPINDNQDFFDYRFGEKDDTFMPLGFACIYNHSFKPNLEQKKLDDFTLEWKATRDIEIGEELCHNYGEQYWIIRAYKKKNLE